MVPSTSTSTRGCESLRAQLAEPGARRRGGRVRRVDECAAPRPSILLRSTVRRRAPVDADGHEPGPASRRPTSCPAPRGACGSPRRPWPRCRRARARGPPDRSHRQVPRTVFELAPMPTCSTRSGRSCRHRCRSALDHDGRPGAARCSRPSASWPKATCCGSTPASATGASTPTSGAPGSSAATPTLANGRQYDRWSEIMRRRPRRHSGRGDRRRS